MTKSAHDRRAIRTLTARLNIARWWNSLGWWEQLLAAGVVWAAFWLLILIAFRPYLMAAVS